MFFRVLKSGFRVEERRFEHVDRLRSCLAVYLIVAWRTLYVCRLGRSCRDIRCEAVFEPAEWKSIWKVVHGTASPVAPPRLGIRVRLVAQAIGSTTVDRQTGRLSGSRVRESTTRARRTQQTAWPSSE